FVVAKYGRQSLMGLAEIGCLARRLLRLFSRERRPLRNVRLRCEADSHLRGRGGESGARKRVRRIEGNGGFEFAHAVFRTAAREQQHRGSAAQVMLERRRIRCETTGETRALIRRQTRL